MVLKFTFTSEMEQALAARARQTRQTVEGAAIEVIQNGLAASQGIDPQSITPGQRDAVWNDWLANRSRREGVTIDDSRESIYGGRGE